MNDERIDTSLNPSPEVASDYDPHFAHREGMWGVTVLAVLTRLMRGKWLIGKAAAIACPDRSRPQLFGARLL